MARYIDADKINYTMASVYWETDKEGNDVYRRSAIAFESDIDTMPTADVVEVKHGENIGTLHPVDEFICSECGIVLEGWTKVVTDEDDGEMYFYEYEFNYCPNCGAKMDGGGRE